MQSSSQSQLNAQAIAALTK